MDDTLAQVVKHCGLQLQIYTDCVDAHKHDWNAACFKQKQALTKCSEEHVTLLKTVKQKCSTVISNYDKCVRDNADDPEKCIQSLRDLYNCTQAVAQDKAD